MTNNHSDAFVFFGATGDLAWKQIFPALQGLIRQEGFNIPIIGVAKAGWNLDQLKARAKDPDDPLELVIVRDMWLTGFDSPSLHTLYVDKPMRGAALMQAIARVNRTFRDKSGGLVVDYIGIAESLQSALADYTARDREREEVAVERAAASPRDVLSNALRRPGAQPRRPGQSTARRVVRALGAVRGPTARIDRYHCMP